MVVIVGMFSLYIHLSSSSSLPLEHFMFGLGFPFGLLYIIFFYRMSASRPTPILEAKFNFGMCSVM